MQTWEEDGEGKNQLFVIKWQQGKADSRPSAIGMETPKS